MIKLKAKIITANAIYTKDLKHCQMTSPIWKITVETMKQLESEQYILGKGFKRIHPEFSGPL